MNQLSVVQSILNAYTIFSFERHFDNPATYFYQRYIMKFIIKDIQSTFINIRPYLPYKRTYNLRALPFWFCTDSFHFVIIYRYRFQEDCKCICMKLTDTRIIQAMAQTTTKNSQHLPEKGLANLLMTPRPMILLVFCLA